MRSVVLTVLGRSLVLAGMALAWVGAAQAADPGRGEALWKTPSPTMGLNCTNCHGATAATDMQKSWNASGTVANQGNPASIRKGINGEPMMADYKTWSDADLADLAAYINASRYKKSLLTNESCVFAWAEGQLPTVFKAPAAQTGTLATINYRLYVAGADTNALGYDTASSEVWILAPGLGFAAPAPLGAATSASVIGMARTANCK